MDVKKSDFILLVEWGRSMKTQSAEERWTDWPIGHRHELWSESCPKNIEGDGGSII
jgi:hypothetical protein